MLKRFIHLYCEGEQGCLPFISFVCHGIFLLVKQNARGGIFGNKSIILHLFFNYSIILEGYFFQRFFSSKNLRKFCTANKEIKEIFILHFIKLSPAKVFMPFFLSFSPFYFLRTAFLRNINKL